jgi:hypothetical protein
MIARLSDGEMAPLLIRKANRNIWITSEIYAIWRGSVRVNPIAGCVASMATMASLSATSRFKLAPRFGSAV